MSSPDEFHGWPALLTDLLAGNDLSAESSGQVMTSILSGEATEAQIAGFLVGLRGKGVTPLELSGLLDAAMEAATLVPLTDAEREVTVDVVGTGGDGSNSINVSTMAAIVVAGAGISVCKHGNRSASSKCGTADVLELLGVAIEQTGDGVAACVREAGIGFCFAPMFHPAFRFAGPPRRQLGIPTVFNMLGPMANPGQVKRQLIGVADPKFAEPMIKTLQQRGLSSVWVVHGDGFDELTTTGQSMVLALNEGEVERFVIDPVEFGLASARPEDLAGGEPSENVRAVRQVLAGNLGPHRDIVILNAGAALVVAGRAGDLSAGIELAAAAIDDGRAEATLDALVAVSTAQSAR